MSYVCPLATFLVLLLASGTAVLAQEKPEPPNVEFRIIPETDGIHRKQPLTLWVFVSNKSSVHLDELSLTALDEAFSIKLPSLPKALPPFGSTWGTVKALPRGKTDFGKHQLPFIFRYRWEANAIKGNSAQTATATVEVRYGFDEEAKGLPGGTAALFSLLFPVIPGAFPSFRSVL